MTPNDTPESTARTSAKRKRETAASRASKSVRSSNTPLAYARRTPPRDPSPPSSPNSRPGSRSPPRKQKRPGARATADREAAAKLQREREEAAKVELANRLVSGAEQVAEHYNAVPERGREWRSTESKIKGLRSLNNWIKSTLIQKFSRPDGGSIGQAGMTVLDMACGKGGDLGKWEKAPIVPGLYVGCDIADVSVEQARQRYGESMRRGQGRGRGRGPPMKAEFHVIDAFGRSMGEIPIVRQVGFDPNAGPGGGVIQGRMGGGGFDVVSMMFALHYSFESERLARGMLKNVAGALKKGGRFIGVMPNSDVISGMVKRLLVHEGDVTPSKTPGKTPGRTSNGKLTPVLKSGAQTSEDGGDWDPEKPSDPDGDAEEEGEWDPEKPSVPQPATADAADLEGDGDGDDDAWDPEKPSESNEATAAAPPVSPAQNASSGTPAAASSQMTTAPPLEWGNSLYTIRFPRAQPQSSNPSHALPRDGVFRPPFGWKYHYSLREAVDAPEFVVPFEALRALAEEYGLELMYRKDFREVFDEESGDFDLGRLAERMGVMSRDRTQGNGTGCVVSEEEWEAATFYHAFVFYKT